MKTVWMVCSVCLATVLHAQDFSLTWTTLDGGGAQNSSGGEFTLSATVGQADAGSAAGAGFLLESGYWGGISDEPGWTVPTLRIGWLAPQQPAVFWPAAATNWTLEAATDVPAATWKDLGAAPIAVGGELAVSIDMQEPRMNYRLHKQP